METTQTNDSKPKGNLHLFCEGDVHMVEYFHKNGVYPTDCIFDVKLFKERSAYYSENDEILIVVQGLTDLTLKEVSAAITIAESVQGNVKSVTVMTNVELGVVDLPYYLYTGDLFYGEVVEIIKGKRQEIKSDTKKGKEASKKGKKKGLAKNNVQQMSINTVMSRYSLYNSRKVKMMIYGGVLNRKVSHVEKIEAESDPLEKFLVSVDIWSKREDDKLT